MRSEFSEPIIASMRAFMASCAEREPIMRSMTYSPRCSKSVVLRFSQLAVPASTRAAAALPPFTSSDREATAEEAPNARRLANTATRIERRGVTVITLGVEAVADIRVGYQHRLCRNTDRGPCVGGRRIGPGWRDVRSALGRPVDDGG